MIGYFATVMLMPGGQTQFIFWFEWLLPIVIEMVGLPTIMTFWLYRDLTIKSNNLLFDSWSLKHLFELVLAAFLVTFGPAD